jgi:hypothetical protein
MTDPLSKENGMPASRISNERGIALAVAIFALVVIGAIVAGTFFAGRLEQQSGQASVYASQAAEAAEAGMSDAVLGQNGNAPALTAMALGATLDLPALSVGANASATRRIQKLTNSLFLFTSLGSRTNGAGASMADRKLGALVRLEQVQIAVNAGLTTIGKATVSGNSTVDGHDHTPSEWLAPPAVTCPTPDDVAGVRYNGQLTQQGSAVIDGDPARQPDNTLTAANMLGGSTFDQLKALKTLTLTGDVSGLAAATTGNPARCDISVESNWGAPTDKASPCFTYFPIIYHLGDLSISGSGEGQGILLVEGNLNVQGRIDFYGPVIVTGGVNIRGTGSDDVKFYGGVMAQDVTLDDSKLSGNATVNYSSCAIRRALQGSAIPTLLSERSWVQLYN